MKKELYKDAELEIIRFDTDDIIITSDHTQKFNEKKELPIAGNNTP